MKILYHHRTASKDGQAVHIEELIAALRRKADKTPQGKWVTGSNYQETFLGRHPTKVDLDQAST